MGLRFIHDHGCGRLAFTVLNWRPGMKPLAADVRLPDGSTPHPGDYIVCGSCGEQVRPETLTREAYMHSDTELHL